MPLFDHFIGTKVLLVGNEPDFGTNGMMEATLVGHMMTCRNKDCPVPLFQGTTGTQFSFMGHILPYDQLMRDFLTPMTANARFHFLLNQFNFKADLHYALEALRPAKPVLPTPVTPKPWYRRLFRTT
jgi:hypothetical protein